MPMLALLLLCAGLFGRDADAGDVSLRRQILQADAGHAGAPAARDPATLQLYRLRQDRVLRVGYQPLAADGQQQRCGCPATFSPGWLPSAAGSGRARVPHPRTPGPWHAGTSAVPAP
ncbi:hypothetical protein G6F66_014582 [Rhizopus arrhizus]|nr:hypothetical protein G6F66_014582 [Rhizopus arrhizus]